MLQNHQHYTLITLYIHSTPYIQISMVCKAAPICSEEKFYTSLNYMYYYIGQSTGQSGAAFAQQSDQTIKDDKKLTTDQYGKSKQACEYLFQIMHSAR